MRPHLPRRRIWRISIYLISLLLILVAADLILVQVRRNFSLGYDTTRVIGPVMPDGRIDYLSLLDAERSEGVTPENNAAVPFLQAVGRWGLPGTQPADGITDKLGMPHLPEQGDYLVTYYNFLKSKGDTTTSSNAPDLPTTWPVTINPLTAEWVKANDHPLELIIQASKRSRFFIPFDGGNRPEMLVTVLLSHVIPFRETGRLLLTRAMIRLNNGDIDGFREDVLAVHHLARLLGQAGTAVERVDARESLEIPACQTDRVAALSGKLSSEQAHALATDIGALGDLPPMSDAIDGERFAILDLLQTLATISPDRAAEIFNAISRTDEIAQNSCSRFAPLPYEAAMRHMNHCYDGALAAMHLPDYPHRIAAMNLWENENASSASGPYLFRILSPAFAVHEWLFSVVRMEQQEETSRAQLRLTQIALALTAYKADHHGYPQSLAELSPAYLPTIPNDPFSEKPLVYSAKSTGYTLYSVGPNTIDDGGAIDDIAANAP
jgi:hypothetical protein